MPSSVFTPPPALLVYERNRGYTAVAPRTRRVSAPQAPQPLTGNLPFMPSHAMPTHVFPQYMRKKPLPKLLQQPEHPERWFGAILVVVGLLFALAALTLLGIDQMLPASAYVANG